MTKKVSHKWFQERSASLQIVIANRSSRNKTLLDKICRVLILRATHVEPADDFMRDPLIDSDEGFDPDELTRFQNGQ